MKRKIKRKELQKACYSTLAEWMFLIDSLLELTEGYSENYFIALA